MQSVKVMDEIEKYISITEDEIKEITEEIGKAKGRKEELETELTRFRNLKNIMNREMSNGSY